MNSKRAEEILKNTKDNIEVTYKDRNVWLENINTLDGSVTVKDLRSNEIIKVLSKDLIERH